MDSDLVTDITVTGVTGTSCSTPLAYSEPGVYSVTVTADDGNGGVTETTFTWTVTNPAPTAVDDSGSTDEDTVLGPVAAVNGVIDPNDSDPDGDALAVTTFTNGVDTGTAGVDTIDGTNGGTFTIAADGSYTFDPDGDFESLAVGESATTSVDYTISDGEGGTDTATLTITVDGVNDDPVAPTIADQTDDDADAGISVDLEAT